MWSALQEEEEEIQRILEAENIKVFDTQATKRSESTSLMESLYQLPGF